jgi:GntR family transcriptional regulator
MAFKKDYRPKYIQLSELLRDRIEREELRSGDQIPTEDALSEKHRVSRGTVRQAIALLVNQGLIRREQGRGTFVNAPIAGPTFFTLTSFNDDMRRQDRQPDTRLLSAETVPASEEVARRLELNQGEPCIHIVRLRLADNQPVAQETRYLAYSLCPSLLEDDLEAESIHSLLIHKYHIPLIRTAHTIEAHILSSKEAQLLQVKPRTAAFFVDRLTYTTDEHGERPAVWYQAIYRGDEYHFKVEFEGAL